MARGVSRRKSAAKTRSKVRTKTRAKTLAKTLALARSTTPSTAKSRATAKRTAAKKVAKPAARTVRPLRQTKPIELYYWPTPNGHKISIMLEECGLPYTMVPVNIAKGDQFKPEFLAISPNNRMPAIVDPQGPGGKPISVFESGAILQYLGRKTGKFYPKDERTRVAVEEWLFWQVGGLGPMAGQANHFRNYAPEQIEYAVNRYTDEVHRLYGVMNIRLKDHEYLAGDYSIADMASIGWTRNSDRRGIDINDFPHLKRWYDAVLARPAVQRGIALRPEEAKPTNMQDPAVRSVLFNQRARAG
jgi:GST-like protein